MVYDASTPLPLAERARALYEGPGAVQSGVSAGTIELRRAAVLRGRTTDRAGAALGGVAVTILDHPELGSTTTRADGSFDMAANGGLTLVVRFSRAGLLPVQRTVHLEWEQFAYAGDVAMTPVDSKVTTVRSSAADMQVVQSNAVSDVDGTRRNTLLIPAGTAAEIRFPNGELRPLGDFGVRATEYTQGVMGPAAMPADLPPTSGYTYAVELSVDEAVAVGATDVRFDQPVFNYVDDFLNFPVGGAVPAAYYDRARGEWVPSKNGRVVQIVSETSGRADVDADGDGDADGPAALQALSFTDAERERLAVLYEPGARLWRVPITHFTPWDYNWPYGPPTDAKAPRVGPPNADEPEEEECQAKGSIISCESQTLGKRLGVTGVPFGLRYSSNRSAGRAAARTLQIPLSTESIPASAKRIDLEVTVAGQRFKRSFDARPDLSYAYVWDGKDAWGAPVRGRQVATVRLGYTYDAIYQTPAAFEQSFAALSGMPLTADRGRQEYTLWQQNEATIGSLSADVAGLGGWDFDIHHAYDPPSRTLVTGDGVIRTTTSIGPELAHVVTKCTRPVGGNDPNIAPKALPPDDDHGTFAACDQEADEIGSRAEAVGPDGSFYRTGSEGSNVEYQVIRHRPDGWNTRIAGTGIRGRSGERVRATTAKIGEISHVATTPDGDVVFVEEISDDPTREAYRIRLVHDGLLSTLAGTGVPTDEQNPVDGDRAVDIPLHRVHGLAIGPDGNVLFAIAAAGYGLNYRIMRIGRDGILSTVAGDLNEDGECDQGEPPAPGEDVMSAREVCLLHLGDFVAGPDGAIFLDYYTLVNAIYRVGTDGRIVAYAGDRTRSPEEEIPADHGDGGAAVNAHFFDLQDLAVSPSGELHIVDDQVIRRVASDGTISRVAGRYCCFTDPGFIAGAAPTAGYGHGTAAIHSLAFDRNGDLIFNANEHWRISSALAGPRLTNREQAIPSADGREVYIFDGAGRHLRTLDGLTGAMRWRFGSDARGRLTEVVDAAGKLTRVERDANGHPVAIIAPGGQRTVLDVDGDDNLVSVVDPAGGRTDLGYAPGALLTSVTDARRHVNRYEYAADGRLVRATDAAGADTQLTRESLERGYRVSTVSALGRKTTYSVERLPDGSKRRTVTSRGGAITSTIESADGSAQTITEDGSKIASTLAADPRWGMLAPYISEMTRTLPSGRSETVKRSRSVDLQTRDPFSVISMRDTTERAARTFTATYDAATRTANATTAEGHRVTTILDGFARIVSRRVDTAEPVITEFDEHGNTSEMRQGALRQRFGYDVAGRLVSRTDAGGRITRYGYDAADRIISITHPSGRQHLFGRDAVGNRTSITTPSGAIHRLGYDQADRGNGYIAPDDAAYGRTHNADGEATNITLPGDRELTRTFDASGRPTIQKERSGSTTDAEMAFSYIAGDHTQRLQSSSRTQDSVPTQRNAYTYDGPLTTSIITSGQANAEHSFGYDSDRSLSRRTLVSAGDTVDTALSRDKDGQVIEMGAFQIVRGGSAGTPTQIKDGDRATLNLGYDSSGQPSTRSLTVAGHEVYRHALSRDNTGAIVERTETINGATRTLAFSYDPDGRVTGVNGGSKGDERYAYDANGNRRVQQIGTEAERVATYNQRDQLATLAGTPYEHAAAGYMTGRGPDRFQYGAGGEMLKADVGDRTIRYGYDAAGRRVARAGPSGRLQILFGNPERPLQITATRDEDGLLTDYLYDDEGFLISLRRGTNRYYVATDQVGSPRVIADSTGTIVKRLEYDAFGTVLADSAPQFELAIGFAGGLRDSETALITFGFRDYDPQSGRWTTPDPLLFDAGQANLYAYVGNDPIRRRDPTGLGDSDWFPTGQEIGNWISNQYTSATTTAGDFATSVAKWLRTGKDAIDKLHWIEDVRDDVFDAYEATQEPGGEGGWEIMKCLVKGLNKRARLPWQPVPTEAIAPIEVGVQQSRDASEFHLAGKHHRFHEIDLGPSPR